MLFATFDIDIGDDIRFVRLEAMNPAWPWWYVSRIIQLAKRVNRKGLVLHADGTSITAEDLAIAHFRDPGRAPEMQSFLDACIKCGLLAVEGENTLRVTHWRRWHRAPSDFPEQVAERVDKHRKAKKDAVSTQCNEMKRDVTNVTTQSRAEQSRAELEENATRFSSTPPVLRTGPPLGEEEVAPLPGGLADGRCAPPPGEDGLRPAGPLSTWALDQVASVRTSGRLAAGERRRVGKWLSEAARGQPEAALRWAITGAVAETRHELRNGTVADAFGFCYAILERHLNAAVEQVAANEISASRGRASADYVWRPPEVA